MNLCYVHVIFVVSQNYLWNVIFVVSQNYSWNFYL